jgi:hypothetical protein
MLINKNISYIVNFYKKLNYINKFNKKSDL